MTASRKFLPVVLSMIMMMAGVCHARDAVSENQVLDSYASGSDLHVDQKTVDNLSSGRSITLIGATVRGNTTAGRELHGEHCRFTGNISAGRTISLDDSQVDGSISAGGDVLFERSTVTGNIKTGRMVTLNDSKVSGSVTSPRMPVIHGSEIGGTLHVSGPLTMIQDSVIGAVKISAGAAQGFQTGGKLFLNGGTIVASQNGRPAVSIDAGGVANVNGYTVRAMDQKTVVIVPGGSVYENGVKVSGDAESRYAAYHAAHADAPEVHGPGWRDAELNKAAVDTGEAMVVLKLLGNTRIQKDIVFENVKGKVILSSGAHVGGDVINGTLEEAGEQNGQ